jgi:hypothetical protein
MADLVSTVDSWSRQLYCRSERRILIPGSDNIRESVSATVIVWLNYFRVRVKLQLTSFLRIHWSDYVVIIASPANDMSMLRKNPVQGRQIRILQDQ